MNIKTIALLLITHGAVAVFGFAAGIYALPILIAPPAPTETEIATMSENAVFSGEFVRDLAGSDGFHWGEGTVSLGPNSITFMGELAPGPDYKLYLSPEFVETEAEFEAIKDRMLRVGDIKTFKNFAVDLGPTVDLDQFSTVVVWCETFGEFITAAKYN